MSTSCRLDTAQKWRKPLKYKDFGKFYTMKMNIRSTLDSAENWAEFVVNKLDML